MGEMLKPAVPRYRPTNWPEYGAASKPRGSLEIWFDPQMHWLSKPYGRLSRLLKKDLAVMERLDFDPSFRWFVGLGIDDQVWDASTFSKNRERSLDGEIAARFLAAILARPQVKRLLSTEHFSVDGMLIEA